MPLTRLPLLRRDAGCLHDYPKFLMG